MSEIKLELKTESYPPEILDKLVVVEPLNLMLDNMISESRRVENGYKTFMCIYIEGLYGSGKTLLMRKFAHELLKNTKKIIPMYIYLGEYDFKLFSILKEYTNALHNYINLKILRADVIGFPDLWKGRLEILDESINEVESTKDADENTKFFNTLQIINKKGYYPAVIFDEFERIIYTGEGLRSDEGIKFFAEFTKRYLEITRGHIFSGIFALVTTFSINELLKHAIERKAPHVSALSQTLNIDIEKRPDLFPMISPSIVYDMPIKIKWTKEHLDNLAQKYNIITNLEIVHLIADVLPTPRAIINIVERAKQYGIARPDERGLITLPDLFTIIKPRYDEFIEKLRDIKINGTFIITPQTKWHENFEELLKNGFYRITRNDYLNIAKKLNLKLELKEKIEPKEEERKMRQKVSGLLHKLSELGLYTVKGGGLYVLNPQLLAYFLGIDRLPQGEQATMDNVINQIKTSIESIRKGKREEVKKEQQ